MQRLYASDIINSPFFMTNVLFVCSFGQVHSPCAVHLFGGSFLEKGLTGASPKRIRRRLKWADRVYIFETAHQLTMDQFFSEFNHKVINLYIDDMYLHSKDKTLIKLMKEQMKNYGQESERDSLISEDEAASL